MGNGPIEMLNASLNQYRQGMIFAIQNGNLIEACIHVRCFISALPVECKQDIPDLPDYWRLGKDKKQYNESLLNWINDHQSKAERSLAIYTAQFYKNNPYRAM